MKKIDIDKIAEVEGKKLDDQYFDLIENLNFLKDLGFYEKQETSKRIVSKKATKKVG